MHTLTWLLWLVTGLLATALAPHPLYLLLVFLAAALVFAARRNASPLVRSYGLFLRAGVWICLGYVLFSVVTVGGARGATLLLRLPELRLPAWLGGVAFGGAITAEALAWGATRGLAIWVLLALFGVFNALVDHYRVLRLAPRSLFHAGLAVTIAVAFVPGVIRAIGEISEAQRARGHRFGGPRSWLPLVGPLLAGSLEKAVQLAEALDARGYGRTSEADRGAGWQQFVLLAGLLLLGAGLFSWFYYGSGALRPVAGALLGAGGLCLLFALRAMGRAVRRTIYRRERWRPADTLVAGACVGCVAALLALRFTGAELVYNPFPRFAWPGFDLRAGLALLLLAVPATAVPPKAERSAHRTGRRALPTSAEAASGTEQQPQVAPVMRL